MKKATNGFTIVELIIVIAVIGVLAAILIPVFSKMIEKANNKSALSDAENALKVYFVDSIDYTGGVCIGEGSIFKIRKADKDWYYTYYEQTLHEGTGAENADPLRPLSAPANSAKVMASDSFYISERDAGTDICDDLPNTVIIYNTGTAVTYDPATAQTRTCALKLHCTNYDGGYYFDTQSRPMLVRNDMELTVGDNEIMFEQIKEDPWHGWRTELNDYEQNNRGWKIIQVEQDDASLTPKEKIIVHLDNLSQDTVEVNVYTAIIRRDNAPSDNSMLNSGRHHVEFIFYNVNHNWESLIHTNIYCDLNVGTTSISVQELIAAGQFPQSETSGYHWELFECDPYDVYWGCPEESELPSEHLDHIDIAYNNEFFVETTMFCVVKLVPND